MIIHLRYCLQKRIKERQFLVYGDSVLFKIHNILNNTRYIFFVDMGTLLGIYRDGRLLKRDMDIDIGIQIGTTSDIDTVRGLLISNGFKHKYIFSSNLHGVIQDTFVYRNVVIDFSYYKQLGDKDFCYMLYDSELEKNKVIMMTCSHISGTTCLNYHGNKINIPNNTVKYLSDRYGTNWRIPDPNYKYWEGPSTTEVDGYGMCHKLF